MRKLKQSTARNVHVFMTDSADHITGKTGLTLTITAAKDGGAFASISPTVTELANGWYSLALTTTHTNTLGDLSLHITSTGADPSDLSCEVIAFDIFDADPGVDVVKWNASAVATPTVAGVPEVDITHVVGISTTATGAGLLTVDVSTFGHTVPGRPVDAYYPSLFKQSESTAARRRVYFTARAKDRFGSINPGDPINSWATVVMVGRISKNGTGGAAAGTFAKVDSTDSPGLWYYEFTASELDTLGIVTLYVSSSGFLGANESQMAPLVIAAHVLVPNVYATLEANVTQWSGGTVDTPDNVGVPNVNVKEWLGDSVATTTVPGVPEVDVTHYRGTAAAVPTVAGIPKAEATVNTGAIADAVWDEARSGHVTAGTFGEGVVVSSLATAALEAVRDKLLDYTYRSGRTVRGLFRRLGASLEVATGLLGSTATFKQPDGTTTEYSVTQDVANGARTAVVVTNSETP